MEYLNHFEAFHVSSLSGLPLGTTPDSVASATRALLSSPTGGGEETLSQLSIVNSVAKGLPISLDSSMSTARSAAPASTRRLRRMPRGKYPSSSADPISAL